jgi:hypothetical protein
VPVVPGHVAAVLMGTDHAGPQITGGSGVPVLPTTTAQVSPPTPPAAVPPPAVADSLSATADEIFEVLTIGMFSS